MKLLILIIFLTPSILFSDKLILGGFSNHSKFDPQEYNEVNYALGYEKNNVEVSVFRNSYDRFSYSLTKITKNIDNLGYRLGVASYSNKPVPVVQFGYFAENYDISFGYVSTVIFKVNL